MKRWQNFSLGLLVLIVESIPLNSYAVFSPDDTFKPYVSSNMLYDSNFLRMSNSVNPVAVTGKSGTNEFMKQVALGLDIDWMVGRQKIVINTNFNQNWFQNYTGLDYLGWNNTVQWNWQAGNDLQGEIGYTNKEVLGNFSQLNGLIANLLNTQKYSANGAYMFHPSGRIKFGYFRADYTYADSSRAFSNLIEDDGDLDLQYLTTSGGYLGVHLQLVKGRYPQRSFPNSSDLDDAYTRFVYEFTWDWSTADSKLRIDGAGGYNQQNYAHLSVRDFGSTAGRINMHWQISEKTLLELSLKRQISQSSNINASFMELQGVYFNPKWQPVPKLDVVVPLYYYQQLYLGETGVASVTPQLSNNTTGIGLNFIYKPLDYINLGTVLNYEKRDANIITRTYETKSIGLNLQILF